MTLHITAFCPVCRGSFRPVNDQQIYCSQDCRSEAARRTKQKPLLPKICANCGTGFRARREERILCTSCEVEAEKKRRGQLAGQEALIAAIYAEPEEDDPEPISLPAKRVRPSRGTAVGRCGSKQCADGCRRTGSAACGGCPVDYRHDWSKP